MNSIQKINHLINDISSQMDDMYLTLFKIRNMVDNGVCIKEINNNEIKFIKGADDEPCFIKSGTTTRISPYEIKKAIRFIKAEHKQELAENAEKFNILRKEKELLINELGANIEFV